ncbi:MULTISPECIES: tetratricopeptide repeat protein [unclassified Aureimonas]|uniref:tetratricopeptide repeat protein n=1 Tax=unclassified Aureimonas TaxID=2615206 RepID=UPI000A91605B|nr:MULTISPECIES: tetratricopeptide repeat protein [unclassified Aureimonas]
MRAVLLFTALVLSLAPVGAFAQASAEDRSLEPLPGLDLPGIEDLLPDQFDTEPDEVPEHPVPPPQAVRPPPAPERAPPPPVPPEASLTREERIDKLFADLKRESNGAAAGRIAQRIESEWADSGSATVDLLVGWAGEAMAKDDKAAAFDLLGEAITMKPDFAESWNRRATLHFLSDDYGKSLADIEQTLAREPRHYGALMGLGAILEETDRKPQALEAYTKVLEIFPAMKSAQDAVGRLSEELSGRAI